MSVSQEKCWVVDVDGNNRILVERQKDCYQYVKVGKKVTLFNSKKRAKEYVITGSMVPILKPLPLDSKKGAYRSSANSIRGISGVKRKRPTVTNKTSTLEINDFSEIKWNAEQQSVINNAMNGVSMFFTGSAGTGKSLLIEKLKLDLAKKHGPNSVHVTATTGISAINVNGQTIHRWSGIGYERTYKMMVSKARAKSDQWRATKVLIVDEVSMLDADLFENLEKVARALRNSSAPFGGIQLILSGDFFQLPPVKRFGSPRFCFEANCWTTCVRKYINLRQIYRQQNDIFIKVLNTVRVGRCTAEVVRVLKKCLRSLPKIDNIEPTRLYSTNARVTQINERRLGDIKKPLHQFKAVDKSYGKKKISSKQRKNYLDNTQALDVLKLKVGAQVILVKNLTDKLVNGSRGVVIGFGLSLESLDKPGQSNIFDTRNRKTRNKWNEEEMKNNFDFSKQSGQNHHPLIKFANGTTRMIGPETFQVRFKGGAVTRTQVPLKCAWALTIHKCQGLSIDYVEISMENMFAEGQFYVALSRCRSLEGLHLKNFDAKQIKASKKVMNFMNSNFTGFRESIVDGTFESASVVNDESQSYEPAYKKRKINSVSNFNGTRDFPRVETRVEVDNKPVNRGTLKNNILSLRNVKKSNNTNSFFSSNFRRKVMARGSKFSPIVVGGGNQRRGKVQIQPRIKMDKDELFKRYGSKFKKTKKENPNNVIVID